MELLTRKAVKPAAAITSAVAGSPEKLLLTTILYHPRKLWVRRVLFQVHLWAGIVLALYAVVISLSGSILVFQDEIRLASLQPEQFSRTHVAAMNTVIAEVRKQFPTSALTYIGIPREQSPWWTLYLTNEHGKPDLAYAGAASGKPLALQGRLFVDWVLDLHVYLLAGRTGFIVNCIAGAGFLLLAVTGAVLWWPGVKLWKRGLTISLRRGWKRINYDLHGVIGLLTLAIVSWWGITAIYFLLPEQVAAAVNAVSPLIGMREPAVPQTKIGPAVVPLETILARVPAIASGHLTGLSLPEKAGGAVTVYLDRGDPGDFSHRDILTFDGHTGELLTIWHYGENRSLGDWVLWLMYPLHFGTLWGFGVKVLWALLGTSVSVLSITGLLMYWNRALSKSAICSDME